MELFEYITTSLLIGIPAVGLTLLVTVAPVYLLMIVSRKEK